jgi:hypothetical protein
MLHGTTLLNISRHFRKKRIARFKADMQVKESDTILDVGGLPEMWMGTGLEHRVTFLNLNLPEVPSTPFRWVRGDACAMTMFEDKSFDVVFSNSVIEHVGEFGQQRRMASEVERIGKRYWVQTPYRHFPLEPHFVFPFFQYLPVALKLGVARTWPFSFARYCRMDVDYEATHIWLLSRRAMQELFPESRILKESLLGLPKSLIAMKP